jgi:response regulator RpfG family c-di-GMP phosphodiesterase
MEHLIAEEYSFLAGVLSLFAAFFILVSAIVFWLSKFGVIVPVNSISHVANGFMIGGTDIKTDSLEPIARLEVSTGDEIENLYNAVQQMARKTLRYIDEAQSKSDTIARMQSNLIMVMADLVESRDKFTGDHVRNTAAYARIIMNQMRREGICSDVLTNEFISNVYQSAPLHDIGKIAVSDTILNKPGRLTAEEFEIMKGHTIAGQQILESAKGAVSESSYLDEAQRLAAYHHEKWDGSGYPYGLAGEEIPLSARIMAVADVFDALVSKRSYKAGFPVDKAFAIIEEGIGTHFDPKVARAFLHARDKARQVAEQSNEKKRLEEEEAQHKAADSGSASA